MPCKSTTQTVSIKLFEKFDNTEFGLESIEFLLSNEDWQVKNAKLNVKTKLTGLRWCMKEWFYVTLLITVGLMTILVTSTITAMVLTVKSFGFL